MTREEAITVLRGLYENPLFSNQHKAAFSIAIHDIKVHHDWDINNLILINKDNYESLEQEPFINKTCVSSEVCEHDKNVVIDKIRAEIDKIYEREGNSVDCLNALDELKWFIDKYKAESESQESDIEKRKPCINYEDGCYEWAGCPCVHYKGRK